MQDSNIRAFYSVKIKIRMRRLRTEILTLLALACLAANCLAAETPSTSALPPSSSSPCSGAAACPTSFKLKSNDEKSAKRAFAKGMKLQQSQKIEEALYEFEEAARLAPQNAQYVTAREVTREHLAGEHLDLSLIHI